MKRKMLLIIVGMMLVLLAGLFFWDGSECGMSAGVEQTEVRVMAEADFSGEVLPVKHHHPFDLDGGGVGIAPRTSSLGSNTVRNVQPFSSLWREQSLRRLLFKHIVRFVEYRVTQLLTSHRTDCFVGRIYPTPLYTFAIRHIII
ncbi:MAG: hypothetical protein II261_11065 [Bacteroidaceae bacterium]|nr:hypothetical protein [Bacteroidaceae bacterium]